MDAAVERQPPNTGFGQAELRGIGRHHDVCAEHHLHPAAQGVAVDAGYHWDVEGGA